MKNLLIASLLFGVQQLNLPARADTPDIEQQLKSAYQGKVLVLRHSYQGDRLRFHSDGSLMSTARIGPWTTDGEIAVEEIAVRQDLVSIKARRIFVVFDSKRRPIDYLAALEGLRSKERTRQEKVLRGMGLEIHIELPSKPFEQDDIARMMRSVFLVPGESMAEIVPQYWRAYFARLEGRPEDPPGPVEQLIGNTSKVSPPREVWSPEPTYADAARKLNYQGIVVMDVVVDSSGTTRDLQISSPLGIGLDDKAIEAVQKWRFSPARKDGHPVAVKITVQLAFRVY